ncbi:MAG TPA: DinB family protein [Gemmatimonadales bacterium]|nr:DinB family protein [Gemmatimonadales bacterium]
MATPTMSLLLWNIQPPAGGRNWHGGPSAVGALRGVRAAQAAWRPTPRRKSVWEMTLHIAYWKYTVRRHLVGGTEPRFPRSPSNFPTQPNVADEAAWAQDMALLKSEHERLIEAVRALSARVLDQVPPSGKRWTYGEMVLGIAAHDAYHVGQIQLLKRLWEERALVSRRPARG